MSDVRQLSEELLRVINEAVMWAAAEEEKNGDWPEYENYPQYEKIREIGNDLYKQNGFQGMLAGHDHVKNANSYAGSLIERMWDGIGGWQH